VPTNNHVAELGAAPKHHLVDPALAASALGLGAHALLNGDDAGVVVPRDGTFLGALFESLVTLDLRVFAQLAEASVGHLRTHRGEHEVGTIVERNDHRVVGFEVKLSPVAAPYRSARRGWRADTPRGPDGRPWLSRPS